MRLVQKNTWSNIWLCPSLNGGPIQWWCGNEDETTACRSGIDAYFLDYTKGTILGFAPLTSSSSAGTKISSDIMTTIFSAGSTSNPANLVTSSPSKTSTSLSMPSQTQRHSTSLPTAVGVGVGVPLGIASLGFLGFLFWKQVGRQRTSTRRSRVLSQGPAPETDYQSATAETGGQGAELPDIQLPRELAGAGSNELPSW